MNKRDNWSDDYWLLLLQIYLKEPVGIKPVYSRAMVNLALQIHVHPRILRQRMEEMARLETPRLKRIWNTYAGKPRKLSRAVKLLRAMNGFGQRETFYGGVEINESWERDFRPINNEMKELTPVILILILNLYFHLTRVTMVKTTPEVRNLARLVKISQDMIVEILDVFRHLDPCLNLRDVVFTPLLLPCQNIWNRYGNGDPDKLSRLARELTDYFK